MTAPNELEFEKLSPVLKRKYFSTLERLRFAQDSVLESPPRTRRLTKSYQGPVRPTFTRHTSYFSRPSSRRSRKSPSPAEVSHEDAQWFQRLPDKVRRRHFTREEQILLAGRRESIIPDATDEALYKLREGQANRSLPSLQSSSSSVISEPSIDDKVSLRPKRKMDDAMLDRFRWLDDEDIDLTLDDYHIHIAETALPASVPSSRRPSFRRTVSLNSLSLAGDSISSAGRPTTSATSQPSTFQPASLHTPAFHPSFFVPHQDPNHSKPHILKTNYKHHHPTIPTRTSFAKSATHYRDPEARLKLRVYLASPQKFDEAIEFGFPSLENPIGPSSRYQPPLQHRSQSSTADAQTFFNDDNEDDNASLFRDYNEGIPSLPDTEAPDAPLNSSSSFRNVLRQQGSKASVVETMEEDDDRQQQHPRPRVWHTRTDPYPLALAGNREMTLRMTLTRPDLRADESVLYPRGQDPLALEELPPMADAGDLWVKPAKDGGRVRKFWRRVSGKP